MPKTITVDTSQAAAVEDLLAEFKKKHAKTIQPWQLALIKTPHQSYKVDADPILVVNEQGAVRAAGLARHRSKRTFLSLSSRPIRRAAFQPRSFKGRSKSSVFG